MASAPTGGAAPRQARSERTRERILRAAVRLFSEHGCDGTTIRDVSESSGIKQPLIFYHFENKEGLWRAAVDEVWSQMEATLVAFAEEQSFGATRPETAIGVEDREQLRTLLRAFVHSASCHPEYLRILLREASHRGPRFRWLVEHHLGRNYTMGSALFASAVAAGLLPDVPIHHLVYGLAGALTFIFAVEADVEEQTGLAPRDGSFLDAHVDALMECWLPRQDAA